MNRSCKNYPFLLLFILSSCITAPVDNVNTKFDLNEAISPVENLNADQRNIATRICYAYESKENNLYSPKFLDEKYQFKIEKKGCGVNDHYLATAELKKIDDNLYKFSSNRDDFYSTIQTASKGYLSQVCESIKNNKVISNTVNIGDKVIQIHFFKDELDSYILKYFKNKVGESYTPVLFETFKIRTQFNRKNNQILGMDVVYESQNKCDDSNDTSIYKQTYLEEN